MLSDMESESVTHDEARRALDQATADRTAFGRSLVLPRAYSLLTGTGNALFVYGIALGNSDWSFGALAFVLGLAAQASLALVAIRAFRERNGAWVSGMAGPRSTKGVIAAFVTVLLPCIVASTWLMVADHPVWSAVVAACALPLTAVADRWWMARYRAAR